MAFKLWNGRLAIYMWKILYMTIDTIINIFNCKYNYYDNNKDSLHTISINII